MTNSKINFYIVELHNNYYYKDWKNADPASGLTNKDLRKEKIRCYMRRYPGDGFEADMVPILAVDSPDKNELIEYFTHKHIYEKNDIAIDGLSYISKREPTSDELKCIAYYSKMLKEFPDTTKHYVNAIEEIEKYCKSEYEEYISSLEELEQIYNSPDLQMRRD